LASRTVDEGGSVVVAVPAEVSTDEVGLPVHSREPQVVELSLAGRAS
jgi:hypothetical protein